MCGIAGASFSPESVVDRQLATQALLTGIAERGADAAGYAWRAPGGHVTVDKLRAGPSALLERVAVRPDASDVLVHARAFTKGHPSIDANNHPIRHGRVIGVHNGVIRNDDVVLRRHRLTRAVPGMTVDSAAIFALVDATDGDAQALEELRGSLACAWLDERRPRTLHAARGAGRPLWLGCAHAEAFVASTRSALETVERAVGVTLRYVVEIEEGTSLVLRSGRLCSIGRFRPDASGDVRPVTAHATDEARRCARRLAEIVRARRLRPGYGSAAPGSVVSRDGGRPRRS